LNTPNEPADRSDWPGQSHIPSAPLATNQALSVVSGAYHTCAVTADGGVRCWGNNDRGQLGDDTLTSRLAPVEVIGLSSGVRAIAAGYMHTCALLESGGVKCWGYNRFGQLGNGEMLGRRKPVDVVGLQSGVTAITAGGFHTCALSEGGGVKCWGYNEFGQVGDGTHKNRSEPVDVARLSSGVRTLSGGHWHTCALSKSGEARCWGANAFGQLGDGTVVDRRTPVKVVGLDSPLDTIAAGYQHTCVRTISGGVKCWGENVAGQLGDGTRLTRLLPVDVSGLQSGVSAITTGEAHSCALMTGAQVKCWGENETGQLGDASFNDHLTPVDVIRLPEGVSMLTAGVSHTCGLIVSGGLLCWGSNDNGQLGTGVALNRPEPANVLGLPGELGGLAAGRAHSCALTVGGQVQCWGANPYGQLGDGTTNLRLLPVDVSGLPGGARRLVAGGTHSCTLSDQGGVSCWGNNWSGQLGDGTLTDRLEPVAVTGLASGVTDLAAGASHTCALTDQGSLLCWGHNWSGQLGDGTDQNRSTPILVNNLASGVYAVATGGYHTCALMDNGGVKCWGGNSAGQLGDGTETDHPTPQDVIGLSSRVISITAGAFHTCAILDTGELQCWGENTFGQLGDGTRLNRPTPVSVAGLWARARSVTAGSAHTCALTRPGGVKCWGDNSYGQLGDDSFNSTTLPVNVIGLSSAVLAITTGSAHTCALPGAGGMVCWGHNSHGQLGDGYASLYPFPVGVLGFQGNFRIMLPHIQRR
jgi:alpha-tubulin suppressor-like RCC1 family protein